MALSRLTDADGSPLSSTDGQPLYVDMGATPSTRIVRVPRESRMMRVGQ